MYDENNKKEFDHMNPDQYKEEKPTEPNFILRDSYSEQQNNDMEKQSSSGMQQNRQQDIQQQYQQRNMQQAVQQNTQQQAVQQNTQQQAMQQQAQKRVIQQQMGQQNTQQQNQQQNTQPQNMQQTMRQQNIQRDTMPAGSIHQQTDQGYGSYYSNSGGNHYQEPGMPEQNNGNGKKKGTIGRKIAGLTAAALLFGTISGGTMVGVNTLADYWKDNQSEESSKSVALAEASKEEAVKETTKESTLSAPTENQSLVVAPAINTDVSAIVEKAMPSVVAINNTMLLQSNSWFGPSQTYEVPSSGSGIIVGKNDDELLIVTNNHVVEDSKELNVVFIDDQSVAAAIKGTDADTDLAVIAVPLSEIPAETMSQITIATMGDSDSLKVGQGVIAIGNALGYGQSVTVGYVSALDREVKTEGSVTRNLLQTDAAINPGNSGGALLNMQGEVIGINAAKYSSTEVEGMGYAIPISKAQDIISELMNKKTKVEVAQDKQGYLGIQPRTVDETYSSELGMPRGVFVYKILEDGAAAKSNLREMDIITKFDGETVRTAADLQDMLSYYEGGDTITLTVQSLENGQYVERTVEVTLGYRSEAQQSIN